MQAVCGNLGESGNSFGYDNAGQKCTNNEFHEYGEKYGVGDVITCLLVGNKSKS